MLAVSRRTLADLPPPSPDIFTLDPPWCPLPARVVTDTLQIDPGLLGVWRMRGLGPVALPAEWTRGRSHAYLTSDVLAWLAARQGEPFDHRECWLTWLHTNLGAGCATMEWLQWFASRLGPKGYRVDFTRAGFASYLALLSSK